MQLMVPERFNKNAAEVQVLGTEATTGTWLIEYMCERLGVPSLAALDVLDFGCGCRFADAIVNNNLPIGSYAGIDVDREMIAWLTENILDPRLSFHHWEARNPGYNPSGFPLTPAVQLPTGGRTFDVICMFSVITHQLPADTKTLFRILRRYVRPRGRMFFQRLYMTLPRTIARKGRRRQRIAPIPGAPLDVCWKAAAGVFCKGLGRMRSTLMDVRCRSRIRCLWSLRGSEVCSKVSWR
jgi:SAM-dependent methyltransferase